MKAAVFSCQGLGDGLISLCLSYNLFINGYEVDTFHPTLHEMQRWFLNTPIYPYPVALELEKFIEKYDKVFVSYCDSFDILKTLLILREGHPEKISILNPCPSRGMGRQPFYSDTFFSSKLSIIDNILQFCENILKLSKIKRSNGISTPIEVIQDKNEKKIVLHPASAKDSKNWPLQKYLKLAKKLKERGFYPHFIMHETEKKSFLQVEELGFPVKAFSSLNDLAKFVCQAVYMIGNDSGVGHLASCLKVPTISIFRNHRSAILWRPSFQMGKIIFPSKLIPNLSIYRLRDKHWKKFVTVRRVFKQF